MNTDSLFGIPIEKLLLFVGFLVATAWGLSSKFSGKFAALWTRTETEIDKARTDLGAEIINRCRDLNDKIEKETGTLSAKVKEDHGTLTATVARIQTDVQNLPEKWRGELDKRFDPISKSMGELKDMFVSMERDSRDRFMDAKDIKANRKEDQEQIASLAVRVINAEGIAKAAQTDVTGIMTNMAGMSSGLNAILRKLEDR